MQTHGARTGRRTLASTSWLLVLVGLSCKYNVTLPWVPPVDGSARTPDVSDVSFDQALAIPPDAPSPDLPLQVPDAQKCPEPREWGTEQNTALLLVAIDRSSSMQKPFESTTRMLAASTALSGSASEHPKTGFLISSFPWFNCGPTCCASSWVWFSSSPGHPGNPDVVMGCGGFDAGCGSTSNDSPSHQVLRQTASSSGPGGSKWWKPATLLIITDQNPSCAYDPNACDTALTEAARLGKQEFKTVVLFPSPEGRTPPECLAKIAQQNPGSFSIISVRDPKELRSKFDEVVSEVETRLCRFSINGQVTPDQIVMVKVSDVEIPRDESGQQGWKIINDEIVLSPNECKKAIANTTYPEIAPDVKAVTCNPGRGTGPYGGH